LRGETKSLDDGLVAEVRYAPGMANSDVTSRTDVSDFMRTARALTTAIRALRAEELTAADRAGLRVLLSELEAGHGARRSVRATRRGPGPASDQLAKT
jgi:hypothetical protein